MYRQITLAFFLFFGSKAAFSQEIQKSELFKGANLIVLETNDPSSTLKEAGKYLVSKGNTIEKYDKDFGQLVTSSKECPRYRTWQCRYIISEGKKSLEWKTEAKSSVDYSMYGHKQNAQWVLACYKIGFKDILEQSKEDVSSFASASKAERLWFTSRD